MYFSCIALVALPILGASASIVPRNPQCTTGSLYCCPQVIKISAPPDWLATLLQDINVNINSVAPAVGLNCVAIAGQTCQTNAVCCTGNHHHSLINISTGCTAITL